MFYLSFCYFQFKHKYNSITADNKDFFTKQNPFYQNSSKTTVQNPKIEPFLEQKHQNHTHDSKNGTKFLI
jgi:hypothetical protein